VVKLALQEQLSMKVVGSRAAFPGLVELELVGSEAQREVLPVLDY
jgi:hypothetical protein